MAGFGKCSKNSHGVFRSLEHPISETDYTNHHYHRVSINIYPYPYLSISCVRVQSEHHQLVQASCWALAVHLLASMVNSLLEMNVIVYNSVSWNDWNILELCIVPLMDQHSNHYE